MPRTHPPTLLTLTAQALRDSIAGERSKPLDARLAVRGGRLLAAVSGGPDSMALLHVLALLRARFGFDLVAHGVDHGLRPAASGELDKARDFAGSLGVPFGRTVVSVAPGGNLQARARSARYKALRSAAATAGCGAIATAHHRDDRAETVLLRLLRGSGPAGLAVLPLWGNGLLRPFLRAPRAAIDAHVARHAIPHSDDPSNGDPRFLRTRVRYELLPLLRALSPGIEEHLCALADQLLPWKSDAEAQALGPLPRASRQELAKMLQTESPTARVALKRGQVARWDPARREVTVLTAEPGRSPWSSGRRGRPGNDGEGKASDRRTDK